MKIKFEIEVLTPIILPGNETNGFFEVKNGEVKIYEVNDEFTRSLDPNFLLSAYAEGKIGERILEKAKKEGKAKLLLKRKLERIEDGKAVKFNYFDDASLADYVLESIFRPLFKINQDYRAEIIKLIGKTSASGFEFNKKEGVIYKGVLYEAVAKGERIEGIIEINYDLSKIKNLFYLPFEFKTINEKPYFGMFILTSGIKIPQKFLVEKFLESMIKSSFNDYKRHIKHLGLEIPEDGNLQIGKTVGNFGICKVSFRTMGSYEEVDRTSEKLNKK